MKIFHVADKVLSSYEKSICSRKRVERGGEEYEIIDHPHVPSWNYPLSLFDSFPKKICEFDSLVEAEEYVHSLEVRDKLFLCERSDGGWNSIYMFSPYSLVEE